MTITVGWFYDEEHKGWNGMVLDRPGVNASSGYISPKRPGSFEEMLAHLVESWNQQTPGEHITVADLSMVEVPPYQSAFGEVADDVHVVNQEEFPGQAAAIVEALRAEERAAQAERAEREAGP
jgi:hypothetical protein